MCQNKYSLDPLGSKNTLRILRFLYRYLNRYVSISQISSSLGTSRSNVHRGLRDLNELGLLRTSKDKGRSLVRIDTSSGMALPFFTLFNREEYLGVPNDIRSVLSDLLDNLDHSKIHMAVLFGSQARLTATKESDIDVLIETDPDYAINVRSRAMSYLPEHRIEIHSRVPRESADMPFIDAVLFGIALIGDSELFILRSSLDSIDKSYLSWRLKSAKENMDRANNIKGPGAEYFSNVAWTTLGEIESIIYLGKTLPKKEISTEGSFTERVETIMTELSRRGDKIWLT